jgi:hypothetical protein
MSCIATTAQGRRCRRAAQAGSDRCHAHSGARVGRPEKLTPALQDRIVAAVRAGAHYEVAARAAGVSRASFHRWRARGERERSGRYHELHEALVRAEAECEVRQLALINRAAQQSYRPAAWLLARRYPERWGRRPAAASAAAADAAPVTAPELDTRDPETRRLLSELLARRPADRQG